MQVLGAPHVAYPQYPAFRICHATSHIAHHTGRLDELRQKSSSGAKGGSVLYYSSSNSKCKPKLRIKHSLLLHMWRSHWSCTQRSAATVGRHAKLISERRVHLCRALCASTAFVPIIELGVGWERGKLGANLHRRRQPLLLVTFPKCSTFQEIRGTQNFEA